ncbi:hypothetical protein KZ793_17635 [Photorhabdus sp. UCH-936]|nr:hypothetical protein [Photorhabdus antumapuensis]
MQTWFFTVLYAELNQFSMIASVRWAITELRRQISVSGKVIAYEARR